jgi:predicted nuclease of predicted toxin-antitoxin system
VNRRLLLLDQMLDEEVAQALRELGHDVVRVSDVGLACADDEAVLERAVREARVLLTLDEHFGDWTVLPLSHHPGVVRIKANPATSRNVLALLLPFLENSGARDFRNQLVILRSRGAEWIRTAAPPV